MTQQVRFLLTTVLSAVWIAFAGAAGAQQYPTKPIRLVVPFGPGGGVDITTRAIAKKLTESMGQTIIVDNRTGANSIIGTQAVARSEPDGYTFLVTGTIFLIVPSMIRNVPYDPLRDFTPVGLIGWVPQILVVHPSLPVKSVDELILLAKARRSELNYASGGNGSGAHMATELFMRQAGIKMTHIPYKSDAPAMVDLLGGQVMVKFDNAVTALPHVKAGKLRALGVTSPNRLALLPDVPSVGERLAGYEASIFYAIFAPAGTPADIVDRMHGELVKFTNSPEIKDNFARQGVDLQSSPSPGHFAALTKTEFSKWSKIIHEAGIKAE